MRGKRCNQPGCTNTALAYAARCRPCKAEYERRYRGGTLPGGSWRQFPGRHALKRRRQEA